MKIDKPDPGNSGTDFQHPKWCGYFDFNSGYCKYWVGFGEALGISYTVGLFGVQTSLVII